MKRLRIWIVGLSSLCASTTALAAGPSKLELKDGDRVVLIGDTLIERDQKYGFLETLLTLQYHGRAITFRNLGWSGDTVFGDSRAGFGTQVDGFKHLKEHVLALKPTVLIVGYGMAESFDGEAGLSRFVEGLNVLLDTLAPTKARLLLLSPITHEDLGRPLPDPARHNQALALYTNAIRSVAESRGGAFVSLQLTPEQRSKWGISRPLTDNGIHPTSYGFSILAEIIDHALCPQAAAGDWQIGLAIEGDAVRPEAHGNPKLSSLKRSENGIRFEALDASLPEPRLLTAPAARRLRVTGLAPGRYALKVEGRVLATAGADDWARGKALPLSGPDFDQVAKLRETINAKNLLYFHRWRPQNETYLFGFRKHEQGNNAREIPLFDPLVEEKEKEIARLSVPAPHVYELVRESEVGP